MRKLVTAVLTTAFVLSAVMSYRSPAGATVVIKAFGITICITGSKNPKGCATTMADTVIVSDKLLAKATAASGKTGTATVMTVKAQAAPNTKMH